MPKLSNDIQNYMNKLGLGTAQFGLNYGVSNVVGQTSIDDVSKILDVAMANEVDLLDTAALYGDSEEVLGRLKAGSGMKFKVITKVKKQDDLARVIRLSLQRLQEKKIYGLLLHDGDLYNDSVHRVFSNLRESGIVDRIGVSLYGLDEFMPKIKQFDIDLVQLPLNVFDRSVVDNGLLKELKFLGKEIHVRSAFLQGLLLMPVERMPFFFDPIKNKIKEFQETAQNQGLSILEVCLGYLNTIPEIDRIICGVNDIHQLRDIIAAHRSCVDVSWVSQLSTLDKKFINPSLWPK